jgi:hypothetical protein
MRVLVCGDRNWVDKDAVRRELEKFPKDTVVLEGEARGADTLGRDVAEELGLTVEKYPADWNQYGKAAGPIRNKEMLQHGAPDLVLAFHCNLSTSRGTKHMVGIAKKAGVPVQVIGAD